MGEPFLSFPLLFFTSGEPGWESWRNRVRTLPFLTNPFLYIGGTFGETFLSCPLLYFTMEEPWENPSFPLLTFTLLWKTLVEPFLSCTLLDFYIGRTLGEPGGNPAHTRANNGQATPRPNPEGIKTGNQNLRCWWDKRLTKVS